MPKHGPRKMAANHDLVDFEAGGLLAGEFVSYIGNSLLVFVTLDLRILSSFAFRGVFHQFKCLRLPIVSGLPWTMYKRSYECICMRAAARL